ncbi:MAG: ABC transporter ATP-binding protein [Acidobacteriota bacterium]
MIAASHISKKYGRTVVVADMTFDVAEGEVLGFLGPNGAGKTTTMRMITGYLPPSSGRVSIGGYDMFDHPIEAKRQIGYLPENPPVYPEMTVRRYLRYVAELKDVPSSRVRSAVDRAIERTQLQEVAGRRIAKLSKGFKQRVGLAQAIVHEPKVLILDEPTSSLDPKQRAEVRDLIAELKGRHTVILSTHILPEVSEVADRVFILNRGKVVAVDSPSRLGDRLRAREVVTAEFGAAAGDGVGQTPGVEQIRAALADLAGVSDVQVEPVEPGTYRARLEGDVGSDLRAATAERVVSQGWRLYGLAGESLSLEEIFLALTRDEPSAGEGVS